MKTPATLNRGQIFNAAGAVAGLAFGLLLTAAPCVGQIVNAALNGSVTDPAGAVIPEASVTAADVAVGITTKTTTDSSGNYTIPHLSPGTYEITVETKGFNLYTLRRNLPLAMGPFD